MPLENVKNIPRLPARSEGENLIGRRVSPVEPEPELRVRERSEEVPGRLMRPVNLNRISRTGDDRTDETGRLRQWGYGVPAAMEKLPVSIICFLSYIGAVMKIIDVVRKTLPLH